MALDNNTQLVVVKRSHVVKDIVRQRRGDLVLPDITMSTSTPVFGKGYISLSDLG